MEAERDRRYTGRKQGRVGCMSGGGSVFRVSALRAVRHAYGKVYFHNTMTEVWMLTFALKHQGYKLLKPQDCVISSPAVATWKALFTQRQRWSHGYIETLSHFGWTRHSVAPRLGQGYWTLVLLIWFGWLGLMSAMLVHGQAFHFQPWVLSVTFLLLFAKVLTVRRLGLRAIAVAATLLPRPAAKVSELQLEKDRMKRRGLVALLSAGALATSPLVFMAPASAATGPAVVTLGFDDQRVSRSAAGRSRFPWHLLRDEPIHSMRPGRLPSRSTWRSSWLWRAAVNEIGGLH